MGSGQSVTTLTTHDDRVIALHASLNLRSVDMRDAETVAADAQVLYDFLQDNRTTTTEEK